jgi:hypothetical protein
MVSFFPQREENIRRKALPIFPDFATVQRRNLTMTAMKCGKEFRSRSPSPILAFFSLYRVSAKGTTMTRTLDVISEVIRTPKNPFRQAADRPEKPQKHRYERRKVKQYIQLGDWSEQAHP